MIDKNTIPAHWEVKKLGEVVKTTSGGTPSRREPQYYNGNIPWVKFGELNQGLILDTEEKISEEAIKNSSAKIFPKGTLLIALYGATIGKLPFLGIDAATNQAVCGIFENENISSNYLYHFLFFSKPDLLKQSIGGAQPNISQTILKDLEIPLPPLTEQQEIVAKIEELLSELDQGKQQLETARQQLKVYRQAVLKWAFEGKLTNAIGNGQKTQEGELPAGWKWVNLKDISDKIFDGPFGSHLKSADYIDDGIRVIRLENIGPLEFRDEYKTFVSEEKYESIKKHTVDAGDIIFSSFIMDQIRVVVLPKFIQTAINKADCFCVRVNKEKANENFLAYYLSTKQVYNQLVNEVHGATRPRINTTQLKSTNIPLPTLEEQNQIVQEIESRLSVCDKVEETITQSLQQAETLRQSILKQAFEGKLVTAGNTVPEMA